MRSRGAPVPRTMSLKCVLPKRDLPHDEQRPTLADEFQRRSDRARPSGQARPEARRNCVMKASMARVSLKIKLTPDGVRSRVVLRTVMTATAPTPSTTSTTTSRCRACPVSPCRPDGSRVVTTVAELNDKRTEYVTAVWEVDPSRTTPGPPPDPRRQGRVVAGVHRRWRRVVRRRPSDRGRRQAARVAVAVARRGRRSGRGVGAARRCRGDRARPATRAAAVVRAPMLPSAQQHRRRPSTAGVAQGQQDQRHPAHRLSDPPLGQGPWARRAAPAGCWIWTAAASRST